MKISCFSNNISGITTDNVDKNNFEFIIHFDYVEPTDEDEDNPKYVNMNSYTINGFWNREKQEGLYFDEFGTYIDEQVEKIPEYS